MIMTPVVDILRNVRSSVDFGDVDYYDGDTDDDKRTAFWHDVIADKSTDSGFGALVNSILENGWDSDSAVGWDDTLFEITEGHHRLVAAILLGVDNVLTSPYGKDGHRGTCAHNCCTDDDGTLTGLLD